MKKLIFLLSLFTLAVIITAMFFPLPSKAQNDQCSLNVLNNENDSQFLIDGKSCLDNLTQALNMSENATKPLESQIQSMQTQIDQIKERVTQIQQNLIIKKNQINQGYKDLNKQEIVLAAAIRDFYVKSYSDSPLLIFLSGNSASQVTQILAYQKAATNEDKAIITNIALSIQDLQTKSKELQNEQTRLSALTTSLNSQSAKLDKIVQGAKAYQASLNNQISAISARQQQILASRLAALNIPLYANTAGSCSSDINPYKDPGFSGTKFGFFTYGVPNRVGLSQYGAFGRAKAGQNDTQILSAYYNYDSISNVNQNIQIHVQGNGIDWTGSLEDYVKRIYEVPNSWGDQGGMEALKAQAIAARSYVLAYTNNGQNPICPTDQCQVFQTNPKGGNWDQAVNQTAGQVMIQGGNPIKAWFSSTHGGYEFSSADVGWSPTPWTKEMRDTSGNVSSFADLQSTAYDKDSPWFYCDWGSRSQYNGTAWLTSSEVADIVNVLLLAQKDPSTENHLYQTDKPNPAGTDTWSADQVKQELQNRGVTPFNSISSISVSADFGSGRTTSVNVTGDAGSQSFSGSNFETYFDLRAPANIQIVGPLYNVETR